MQFGAGFPLTAMDDSVAIRDFAHTLDGAGFGFVTASGHVLSSEPGAFPSNPTPTYAGPFHDPFVLFGYLSGLTQRLHFRTSILILPLFPTGLIAKQAAELDTISGGRFELGVGISWNTAEYRAMNQDFKTRGRRIEEQVTVLRRLWSEPFLTYEGRWHHFERIGLNRTPPHQIPIWFGTGTSDEVLRRVARLADGWICNGDPAEPMVRLRRFLEEAGRNPDTFGLTARVTAGADGRTAWVQAAQHMQAAGATHIAIGAPPDLTGEAALQRLLEAKQVLAEALG
jgi:probable F420-dependent oxidoreductase